MKGVGCVVLVIAVVAAAVVGFLVLVGWGITRGDDQSALTERIDLRIVEVREEVLRRGKGYVIGYAYEVDGQWYGGQDEYTDDVWQPSQGLTACIDPDRPRDHVVTERGQLCGQERIYGNLIQEATPRPAP